jgi:HK97 family phage major capsid protein
MARRSLLHPPANPMVNSRFRGGDDSPGLDASTRQLGDLLCMAGQSFSSGDSARYREAYDQLHRTGVTYVGTSAGFALKPEWAESVYDKARMIDGPFARVRWGTSKYLEFNLPIYNETQRSNNNRWGGVVSSLGAGETASMTTNQGGPSLSNLNYHMRRLTVFSVPISRDLLADSELVLPMLDYAAKSEIRFEIDAALIGTAPTVGAPEGVVNGPNSIVVSRAGGGAIAAADLDGLWASIAGPNRRNACWFASDEVISTLDGLAQASVLPQTLYMPQGQFGNPYPLIKGRPLLFCEACPAKGNPGDIVVADFSDYTMIAHRTDSGSTLAFNVTQPTDSGHTGVWGLPAGTVESRSSDEFLFTNDEVVFLWKARLDGHFNWSTQVTNINGSKVGPAAYLSK